MTASKIYFDGVDDVFEQLKLMAAGGVAVGRGGTQVREQRVYGRADGLFLMRKR